jgi:hypothetical protein
MTDDVLGPISYLVVEFPGNNVTGEGLPNLVDLVDRNVIRVLDLDGRLDMTAFEGVSSGLLDDSDLADAAAAVGPGSSAAILLFENRVARSFTQALRRGGAELVAAG